jgi:alcohol dehydrogenase class IV
MRVFQTTPRLLMGRGTLSSVTGEAQRLGATTVAVLAGPNIVKAGYVERIEEGLRAAGIHTEVFTDIEPEPSVGTAIRAGEAVRECAADLIVGIGGGSNMDVAKAASVLATNDLALEEMYGVDLVPRPGLDKILIPTTAGTGSEVTPHAVLTDSGAGTKRVVAGANVLARVAILDPELTLTLPADVTAYSGMDALVHAIEAFTSVNAVPLTDLFAVWAMQIISSSLRRAFRDGGDIEAREAMLEGSMAAGVAFGNAGVTATHAFAYPLGALFGIPHGKANTIMLPAVMEYNLEANPRRFALINGPLGIDASGLDDRDAALKMVEGLRAIIADLELPTTLSEFGIGESDIGGMSADVVANSRILANNHRSIGLEDAEAIYRSVL